MARTQASRRYQLTLNNPELHDWSHEFIKNAIGTFAGLIYWCMCDEIGETGTPHTHIFVMFKNAVQFTTIQKVFYGAHIEAARGSNQENRDYIRKEGAGIEEKKKETNIPETFEEYGELPPDRAQGVSENAEIYEMIKQGKTDFEILEEHPNAINRLDKIRQARLTVQNEIFGDKPRFVEVTYIWGKTGVGKTRSVTEKYGYRNVYRVTNYKHPFDQYQGQDVILFDEYRSQLTISEFLNYLDVHPTPLACRYADRQACYTKVFIISNIPLEKQYRDVQREDAESWIALKRRIQHVYEMLPDASGDDWTKE
ncbi:MAG: replication protein [Firmicutes bacterium HGW-Firmicutes-16]|nr:MAG: replication protein [Firmicutes bacterium HGW-Firmicutes-16]